MVAPMTEGRTTSTVEPGSAAVVVEQLRVTRGGALVLGRSVAVRRLRPGDRTPRPEWERQVDAAARDRRGAAHRRRDGQRARSRGGLGGTAPKGRVCHPGTVCLSGSVGRREPPLLRTAARRTRGTNRAGDRDRRARRIRATMSSAGSQAANELASRWPRHSWANRSCSSSTSRQSVSTRYSAEISGTSFTASQTQGRRCSSRAM